MRIMKQTLALVIFNLFGQLLASTSPVPQVPEQPLMAVLMDVGMNYATFNVSGPNIVDGMPVVDIDVSYRIDSRADANPNNSNNGTNTTTFWQIIKITALEPGHRYHFNFSAVNGKKQAGLPSKEVAVLLLPDTPDISVMHPLENKLVVQWSESKTKTEDFFLLTVEKKSAIGCGVTVNINSCYGNMYSIDDLQIDQTYVLTMRAHNPSGYSEPVLVTYPID